MHPLVPRLTVTNEAPTIAAPLGLHFFVSCEVPVYKHDIALLLNDMLEGDEATTFGYSEFQNHLWNDPHYAWTSKLKLLPESERNRIRALGYQVISTDSFMLPAIDAPLYVNETSMSMFNALSAAWVIRILRNSLVQILTDKQKMLPGFFEKWMYVVHATWLEVGKGFESVQMLHRFECHMNADDLSVKCAFMLAPFQHRYTIRMCQDEPHVWYLDQPDYELTRTLHNLWPDYFVQAICVNSPRSPRKWESYMIYNDITIV